jgi:hypothetical protein
MKVPRLRFGEYAPYIFFVLVAVAIAVGFWQGIALAVLMLAVLAFALAILLLWGSVFGLSGDTPLSLDEAIAFGAPSAEEEQKRAVLRALKDLEYERSVGKISEDDYQEFSRRYREDARRLISLVDESMVASRELAEKLLAQRVKAAGISEKRAKTEADSDADGEPESESQSESGADADAEIDGETKPESKSEAPRGATLSCPSCSAVNDTDARFCKRCGAVVGEAPPKSARAGRPPEENLS